MLWHFFGLVVAFFTQKKCNGRHVMSICSEKWGTAFMFNSLVVPATSMKECCGELFSFQIYFLSLLHGISSGYQRLLVSFCKTVLSRQADTVKNQFKLWKNCPSYSTYNLYFLQIIVVSLWKYASQHVTSLQSCSLNEESKNWMLTLTELSVCTSMPLSVSQLRRKMSMLRRKAYSAAPLMSFSWITKWHYFKPTFNLNFLVH